MTVVCIEGWRDISHSYALVNQWQMLSLLDRGLELRHRDRPPYRAEWAKAAHGSGLSEADRRRIADVPPPRPGETLDLVYRMTFPADLTPADARRWGVFVTCELQSARGVFVQANPAQAARREDVFVVTPSQWSRTGLLKAGFAERQVHVVPHGVDPATFAPVPPALRASVRASLGLAPDAFVLLSVGAMTGNKGIVWLLLAYAHLRGRYPHVRLVLKDQSVLYGLTGRKEVAALRVQPAGRVLTDAVIDSIVFESRPLSVAQLRALYGAADAYVSPYMAEGFGLTPLEAAACGVPIVVTQGGATDEYFHPCLGLPIASDLHHRADESWCVPRLESLIAALTRLVEGRADCGGAAASAYVHRHFSWAAVTERLCAVWGAAAHRPDP